jgi:hypothetical protein
MEFHCIFLSASSPLNWDLLSSSFVAKSSYPFVFPDLFASNVFLAHGLLPASRVSITANRV